MHKSSNSFFLYFLGSYFLLQNLDTYVLIILQNNLLSYYNFGHFETAETNSLHFEEEFIKRTPTFMCFVLVNERLFLLLVTKIGNCSTQIHFYCTGRIFGFYDENVTCLLLKTGKQMCRPRNFLRKFHFFWQTYVLIKSQNSIFILIHLMFFRAHFRRLNYFYRLENRSFLS